MKFLITAGGTREYIDPVRYITNASSGRMGYALARAAINAGHSVILITTPTSLKTPKNADVINVQTSKEMFKAVKDNFPKCHCLIMAAAVSDYTPANPSKIKLKKQNQNLTLELKPTTDILKWAGRNKKDKIVVGFALEDKNILENAEKKLDNKKIDMIVANSVEAIGAEKSTLFAKIKGADWVKIDSDKSKSAKIIISMIKTIK
jgi:phosphopantothenoylcysteine synthetase/decarboxylase